MKKFFLIGIFSVMLLLGCVNQFQPQSTPTATATVTAQATNTPTATAIVNVNSEPFSNYTKVTPSYAGDSLPPLPPN